MVKKYEEKDENTTIPSDSIIKKDTYTKQEGEEEVIEENKRNKKDQMNYEDNVYSIDLFDHDSTLRKKSSNNDDNENKSVEIYSKNFLHNPTNI